MQALLTEKGKTIEDVEILMNWPVIPRTSDGQLYDKTLPLNLAETRFSRVEGVKFNLETGEISIILQSSTDSMKNILDWEDFTEILERGISGAQLTLDQPDPKFPDHPFQEMKYAPQCLVGTRLLGTMLHADLDLKGLTTGIMPDGRFPFTLRDAEENLYKRLSPDFRKAFKEFRDNKSHTAGKVHRFWIQMEELFYRKSQSDNTITIMFDECRVSVKKHQMRYDSSGKLVDTEKDDEDDSPEAKIAKLMTEKFHELGEAFLEMARLPEMAKIQAISVFAQNIYASMKESSEKFTLSYELVKKELDHYRKQISVYPQNTQKNRTSQLNETLIKNNLSSWQVPLMQLNDLKEKIERSCIEADRNILTQLTTKLSTNYHVEDTNSLRQNIDYWLQNNQ